MSQDRDITGRRCLKTEASQDGGVSRQRHHRTVVSQDRGITGRWCLKTEASQDGGVSRQRHHRTVVSQDRGITGRWCLKTEASQDGGVSRQRHHRTVVSQDGWWVRNMLKLYNESDYQSRFRFVPATYARFRNVVKKINNIIYFLT